MLLIFADMTLHCGKKHLFLPKFTSDLEIMYAKFLVDVNIIIVQKARPARLREKCGQSE